MTPIRRGVPMEQSAWKVRADDLRRIAAKTSEPERERKMLALAEQLERAEAQGRVEDRERARDR
jgi:hypothetical protein